MERRLFLQALIASVVAAGAPLPAGFPREAMQGGVKRLTIQFDGISTFGAGTINIQLG